MKRSSLLKILSEKGEGYPRHAEIMRKRRSIPEHYMWVQKEITEYLFQKLTFAGITYERDVDIGEGRGPKKGGTEIENEK